MPAWPGTVPHTVIPKGGFSVSGVAGQPISSPMQSGKLRMRRQFTRRTTQVEQTMRIPATAMGALETFLVTTVADGTAEFDMPVFRLSTKTFVTKVVQIQGGAAAVQIQPVPQDPDNYDVTLPLIVYDYNL